MTCATGEGSLSLDLKVWATPLAVSGRFTVFAIRGQIFQRSSCC